jgi:hypothetical protein
MSSDRNPPGALSPANANSQNAAVSEYQEDSKMFNTILSYRHKHAYHYRHYYHTE